MPEWTPAQQIVFEDWKRRVSEVYRLYGYTFLETPAMERSEVLAAKTGAQTQKQIYRIAKDGASTSLRFDLTVPLARYVSAHQSDLPFPFRRQAIGKVWRGERAQKGRFREFYQADADIIGREKLSLTADAEILAMVADAIEALCLGDFQLQISNRKVVIGFLDSLKVMDKAQVIQLLDDADKMSAAKLRQELELLRLDVFEIRKILKFASIRGDWDRASQELLALDYGNEEFNQGLDELGQLDRALRAFGLDPRMYQYNFGIIRGLDYYTGMIYETKLVEHPEIGSISSGGRYDNLVGAFSHTKYPGVGCSIGLTRLFSQAVAADLVDIRQTTVSQVCVLPFVEELEKVATVVRALRQSGIATELYLEGGGLTKSLRAAAKLGVPYVLIIGGDELAAHRLTLKNMSTGEQESLNLAQVIDTLQQF